jgi:hypothetical protein
MDIIFGVLFLILFWKLLGFVLRAGWTILGWAVRLAGFLLAAGLAIGLAGIIWSLLPVAVIVCVISKLVRLA